MALQPVPEIRGQRNLARKYKYDRIKNRIELLVPPKSPKRECPQHIFIEIVIESLLVS